MSFKDDIIIKNATKPFSSIVQTTRSSNPILCSLCANVGIESIVRDDVCGICGDIGIKHGISTGEDDLFVVNSVGGGRAIDTTQGSSTPSFSRSFGGLLESEKKRKPPQQKTLQDAIKETELS